MSFARFTSLRLLIGTTLLALVSACSNWLPTSGPSTRVLEEATAQTSSMIQLVEINGAVNSRNVTREQRQLFSESFGANIIPTYAINPGDVLAVSIWEANPALLFGASPAMSAFSGSSSSKNSSLPDQMVGADGHITVPFAGRLRVAGKTIAVIEAEIVSSLQGKANSPQVIVQMTKGNTSNVTVVGEVGKSDLVPLTPKGERLLDAIALAGGVKQAVNKITLQISRQGQVRTMALDRVIQDPAQNIRLNPGDVITAFFQPFSFTALGATGKNDEINFEASGISLAQALGRIGGVQDSRADVKGVFVFRFEEPDASERLLSTSNLAPLAQAAKTQQSQPVTAAQYAPRAQSVSTSTSGVPVAQTATQQNAPAAPPPGSQPLVSPRGVIPACAACVQALNVSVTSSGATAVVASGVQQNVMNASASTSRSAAQSALPSVSGPSGRAVAALKSNPTAIAPQQGIPATQFTDSQGRVPTIYRLDMSDPSAFLVAQGFLVKNKDVIYVANASSAELTKFLSIMVQVLYPIVNGKILIN